MCRARIEHDVEHARTWVEQGQNKGRTCVERARTWVEQGQNMMQNMYITWVEHGQNKGRTCLEHARTLVNKVDVDHMLEHVFFLCSTHVLPCSAHVLPMFCPCSIHVLFVFVLSTVYHILPIFYYILHLFYKVLCKVLFSVYGSSVERRLVQSTYLPIEANDFESTVLIGTRPHRETFHIADNYADDRIFRRRMSSMPDRLLQNFGRVANRRQFT